MNTYEITYWTAGDAVVTRVVNAETLTGAMDILSNDTQAPLAQLKEWRVIREQPRPDAIGGDA